MQTYFRKFSSIALSAAALISISLPANAVPRAVDEIRPQSDITNVRWVCDRHRRCWEEPDGFGIEIGPGGVEIYPGGRRRPPPPPRPRRHGMWDAHVNWCLHRYRSYNPRTDRYRGYDGRYHRCHSPYN